MSRTSLSLLPVALVILVAESRVLATAAAQAEGPRVVVGPNVAVSGDLPDVPHVEPHLAINPRNPEHLVAAAMVFPRNAQQTCAGFTSFDGGRSWTRAPLGRCRADPWVAFTPDGTPLISNLYRGPVPGTGTRSVVWIRGSTDGGRTWENGTMVPLGLGSSSDRPILLVDRSTGPRSGAVYSVRGQAFTPGVKTPGSCEPCWYGPSISSSTDSGRTFGDPAIHALNSLDNQIQDGAVLSDGTLAILTFDFQQGQRHTDRRYSWLLLSHDGGRTLSPPLFVAARPADRLAVDPAPARRDRLYVVVAGALRARGRTQSLEDSDGSDVFVLSSEDRGSTWSAPVHVSDSAGSPSLQDMPMIAVAGDGTVGVAWYDRRDDPAQRCAQLYFSASVDGGRSFGPNVRVSGARSCPATAANRVPQPGGDTLDVAARWPSGGDYNGMVGGPNGDFRLLWADSRSGVYQLWAARVTVEVPKR